MEVGKLPGLEGETRLYAAPVQVDDEELIVVVGSSLQDRDEALSSLTTLMLIGGPVGLLLASLAGYGVAAAALRPVEEMRGRAAEISAGDPGERLPVPAADDELSRLGYTLNEMLDRLEDALARERRFVDDAAHELRTPLALHKTELELALRYGADAGELREAISSAAIEIDRLIQLAEDLLVVARAEDGQLKLSSHAVDAADLLDAVAERFRARAEESGRALAVDAAEGIELRGDRLRLEQALTSMVDNALRHGGGQVRLRAVEADGRSGSTSRTRARVRPRLHPPGLRALQPRGRRPRPGRRRPGPLDRRDDRQAHGGRAVAANGPEGGADVWIELRANGSFQTAPIDPASAFTTVSQVLPKTW